MLLIRALLLALGLHAALAAAEPANPARAHLQAYETAQRARLGLPARDTAAPQIIGGSPAPAGAYPAVVALLFSGQPDNADAFYCGGTLVSPTHVLTAAHCVDFLPASDIAVLVGTQSLAAGGTRVAAAGVSIHPGWNPEQVVNDVAVITLAEPASGITPMPFVAGEGAEDRFAAEGAASRVAGWGQTATSGSGIFPTELQHAPMSIVAQACNGSTVICAGSPGHVQGVCFGDSGGPLFSERLVRGRRVQVGISSFVVGGCGDPAFPDFFARLAALGPWVREQIGR